MTEILICIIFALLSVVLASAVHHTGHMLGGMMSGYRLASFRVLWLTVVKCDGKYTWRLRPLTGYLCRCVMRPPRIAPPYRYVRLYMGGFVGNFIAIVLSILLYTLLSETCLGILLLLLFLCNSMQLVINLLPFYNKSRATDNYMIIMLTSQPEFLSLHYKVMRIESMIERTSSVLDIPRKYMRGLPQKAGKSSIEYRASVIHSRIVQAEKQAMLE